MEPAIHIPTNSRPQDAIEIDLSAFEDGSHEQLQAINSILAGHRLQARPFEAKEAALEGELPGPCFLGASIVQTRDNRFYLHANVQYGNEEQRNCAEVGAISRALNDNTKARLKNAWFMGGMADLANDIHIMKGELYTKHTPCGSCRHVIWDRQLRDAGLETMVHVLPLNHGDFEVSYKGGGDQAVLSMTARDMLPDVVKSIADEGGRLKQMIIQGYEWLFSPEHLQSVANSFAHGPVQNLENMDPQDDALMKKIHERMMGVLKEELHREGAADVKEMEVAVVRTQSGHYYMGRKILDGEHPATVGAIYDALHALNRGEGITDVYFMKADLEHVDEIQDAFSKNSDAPLEVTMPDGDARERSKKFRHKNGDKTLPRVHVFHVADPSKQDTSHVIHTSNAKLLPFGYRNHKEAAHDARCTGH